MDPSLVTVGFSPSEQLLGCDFSLRHDDRDSGCGKSEKGGKVVGQKNWRSDPGGRRKEEERRTRCRFHLLRMGEEALQGPVWRIHHDETNPLWVCAAGGPFGTGERGRGCARCSPSLTLLARCKYLKRHVVVED